MFMLAASDWWTSIQIFFHEMDSVVKILFITVLMLIGLLALMRVLKPFFSADKGKFRILPLLMAIVFIGLACFVIFI